MTKEEISKEVSVREETDLAAVAVNASAKAEIQAGYVMALQKPRKDEDARAEMIKMCRNPRFAEKAIYKKPVGGRTVTGPSIRFAEEMFCQWGNIKSQKSCIYEDDKKKIVKISVIDLETNASFSEEITIVKTVERKFASEDREIVSERINTKGQRLFIVKATEDELLNKEQAMASKILRNNSLRLVPQNIIDDCMDECRKAISAEISDNREVHAKRIVDSFIEFGVKPSDIEKKYGCKVIQLTPPNIAELKEIYATIRDGQAKWQDYLEIMKEDTGKVEKVAEKGSLASFKPADEPPPAKKKRGRPKKSEKKEPEKASEPPVSAGNNGLVEQLRELCFQLLHVGHMYFEGWLCEMYSKGEIKDFNDNELQSVINVHLTKDKDIKETRESVVKYIADMTKE